MARKISAIIADEHTITRCGIRFLLSRMKVNVLAEAANGRDAVALVTRHLPTVVLLDVPLPHLNGIEAARQIITTTPTRVIMLTNVADDYTIDRAMLTRVHGFVLKDSPLSTLEQAVKTVGEGGEFLEPRVREHNARYAHLPGYQRYRDPSPLTPREREIVQLLAEGFSNKEIGAQLKVSLKTVENQRSSIFSKLNVHDIAGVTQYAISAGIVAVRSKL